MSDPSLLRFITYLAPSIPREFFERIAAHVAETVGSTAELQVESRRSGPMHGDTDPFRLDTADVGFLCSPSYLYLRQQPQPSVQLVQAGFVFRHGQAAHRPVYFSDVVVRSDHPAQSFADLTGSVWGFNDECSLSGHFSMLQHLRELGYDDAFFGQRKRTGSHLRSLEAVLSGTVDAAAIDSTVLALQLRSQPEWAQRLRVLESWGPFPIQPIVMRSSLDAETRQRISDAFLALDEATCRRLGVDAFGLERCVAMDEGAYADERQALADLGQL